MRPARETVRAVFVMGHAGHAREKVKSKMQRKVRWPGAMVLILLGLSAQPARAWSELGHALVGDLAEAALGDSARQQVRTLLEGEREPTLGGVASWADALRYSDAKRFRATSRWHYINARGGGCVFAMPRDCAGGDCVVGAIEAQRRILADRSQPLTARRDALKFLVHFIGDVHQPLHAGNRTDSGGNRFQIQLRTGVGPQDHERGARRDGMVGTNLHSVWDHYVLASAGLARERYAAKLSNLALALRPMHPGSPLDWARESCALIDAEDVYPEGHTLDDAYLAAQRPLAERRIAVAAARLAALLEATLVR